MPLIVNQLTIRWKRLDVVRRMWKRFFIAFVLLLLGCLLSMQIINHLVKTEGGQFIVQPVDAPHAEAILVPGARVFPDGRVSDILHDRLQAALDLYNQGKAPKILVSGDHGRTNYDEVRAMRAFLTERGVPAENVFMDHAGFSTYESVYRAKAVFQINKLIVVTQDYHLRRAVYDARHLGIEAYGVTSDLNSYRGIKMFEAREALARNKDFWFVNVLKPKPTYLGDVIPISGDGRVTDDK